MSEHRTQTGLEAVSRTVGNETRGEQPSRPVGTCELFCWAQQHPRMCKHTANVQGYTLYDNYINELWSGNPTGRDHLQNLGVDEKVILK
jgi:hypothetical protein